MPLCRKMARPRSTWLPEAQGQRTKEAVEERRRLARAAKPDAGRYVEADKAWVATKRLPQSIKCFEMPLAFRNGELTLPRSYIQAMKYAHGPFGQFAQRARTEPGWKAYEIDSSHSPNVTAPDALMTVLGKVIRER